MKKKSFALNKSKWLKAEQNEFHVNGKAKPKPT